jgi:enamine deaminase RidA (YjgF/YER057c/UK114 family)
LAKAKASPNSASRRWPKSIACSPLPAPDKSKILQTIIYISDIGYFAEMNAAWEAWVDPANTPARATSEAKLAAPKYKVEFIVTAAI